jgi:hypothetical protein
MIQSLVRKDRVADLVATYGGFDDARLDTLFLLRMFEKRLTTYRAIGYARSEAPLGFAEPLARSGRFDLKDSNGPMPHEQMMRSIELIGTEVVPRVHDLLTPDVRTTADRRARG